MIDRTHCPCLLKKLFPRERLCPVLPHAFHRNRAPRRQVYTPHLPEPAPPQQTPLRPALHRRIRNFQHRASPQSVLRLPTLERFQRSPTEPSTPTARSADSAGRPAPPCPASPWAVRASVDFSGRRLCVCTYVCTYTLHHTYHTYHLGTAPNKRERVTEKEPVRKDVCTYVLL